MTVHFGTGYKPVPVHFKQTFGTGYKPIPAHFRQTRSGIFTAGTDLQSVPMGIMCLWNGV